MTAPSPAALERLFEPWRETLRAARLLRTRDDASARDDPSVWVVADFPHDDLASVARLVEAIELFVLLNRVDANTWLNMARRFARSGRADPWTRLITETRACPRVCGWRLVVTHIEDIAHMCMFLAEATEEGPCSAEYVLFGHILEDAIQPKESEPISMVLSVSLAMNEWRIVWVALTPILTLAAIQASVTTDTRIDKLCSQLERVKFLPTCLTPADEATLDQFQQLGRLGVAIERFPDLGMNTVSRGNAVAFVKTVKTLLGSRSCGASGRTRRVAILSKDYPLGSIESATTDATMLDHVFATCTDNGHHGADEQKRELYWMAYALFRCDTNTSVRNMRVNCEDVTVAKVETMEELVRADNPLGLLFEDLASSIDTHKRTRLSASRFLLFDPTIEASEYPVLDSTGETTIDGGMKMTESLELVSPRDRAATVALLRLVGAKVINLHLTEVGAVPENWWTDIFSSCPEVQELYVDGITWRRLSAAVESLARSRVNKLARFVH